MLIAETRRRSSPWQEQSDGEVRVHDVVIIGAGPAGLAAAHELARVGIDASILERESVVGSSWRARHEELRLNTIRWLSELPGLRMPRRYGRWVKRDDYVAYLEEYVRSKAISIEYGAGVTRIRRSGAVWRLDTAAGVRYARHVVVATGPDRIPWIPAWAGATEFEGGVRHVATVSAPREMSGRDVIVVGGGNSGVEWSEQLVMHHARSVWLSIRRPPNLLPREAWGVPLHPLAVALEHLPIELRDQYAGWVRRVTIGDLRSYGLPIPDEGPYRTLARRGVTVAVDAGFGGYVREGRIKVVPQIESFTAREVVLADGSRLSPDMVVAATGFRTGLEELVGHLRVLSSGGRPLVTEEGRSSQRGLWFIGFTTVIEGTLRRHRIEARRIALAISRELSPRDRERRVRGGPTFDAATTASHPLQTITNRA